MYVENNSTTIEIDYEYEETSTTIHYETVPRYPYTMDVPATTTTIPSTLSFSLTEMTSSTQFQLYTKSSFVNSGTATDVQVVPLQPTSTILVTTNTPVLQSTTPVTPIVLGIFIPVAVILLAIGGFVYKRSMESKDQDNADSLPKEGGFSDDFQNGSPSIPPVVPVDWDNLSTKSSNISNSVIISRQGSFYSSPNNESSFVNEAVKIVHQNSFPLITSETSLARSATKRSLPVVSMKFHDNAQDSNERVRVPKVIPSAISIAKSVDTPKTPNNTPVEGVKLDYPVLDLSSKLQTWSDSGVNMSPTTHVKEKFHELLVNSDVPVVIPESIVVNRVEIDQFRKESGGGAVDEYPRYNVSATQTTVVESRLSEVFNNEMTNLKSLTRKSQDVLPLLEISNSIQTENFQMNEISRSTDIQLTDDFTVMHGEVSSESISQSKNTANLNSPENEFYNAILEIKVTAEDENEIPSISTPDVEDLDLEQFLTFEESVQTPLSSSVEIEELLQESLNMSLETIDEDIPNESNLGSPIALSQVPVDVTFNDSSVIEIKDIIQENQIALSESTHSDLEDIGGIELNSLDVNLNDLEDTATHEILSVVQDNGALHNIFEMETNSKGELDLVKPEAVLNTEDGLDDLELDNSETEKNMIYNLVPLQESNDEVNLQLNSNENDTNVSDIINFDIAVKKLDEPTTSLLDDVKDGYIDKEVVLEQDLDLNVENHLNPQQKVSEIEINIVNSLIDEVNAVQYSTIAHEDAPPSKMEVQVVGLESEFSTASIPLVAEESKNISVEGTIQPSLGSVEKISNDSANASISDLREHVGLGDTQPESDIKILSTSSKLDLENVGDGNYNQLFTTNTLENLDSEYSCVEPSLQETTVLQDKEVLVELDNHIELDIISVRTESFDMAHKHIDESKESILVSHTVDTQIPIDVKEKGNFAKYIADVAPEDRPVASKILVPVEDSKLIHLVLDGEHNETFELSKQPQIPPTGHSQQDALTLEADDVEKIETTLISNPPSQFGNWTTHLEFGDHVSHSEYGNSSSLSEKFAPKISVEIEAWIDAKLKEPFEPVDSPPEYPNISDEEHTSSFVSANSIRDLSSFRYTADSIYDRKTIKIRKGLALVETQDPFFEAEHPDIYDADTVPSSNNEFPSNSGVANDNSSFGQDDDALYFQTKSAAKTRLSIELETSHIGEPLTCEAEVEIIHEATTPSSISAEVPANESVMEVLSESSLNIEAKNFFVNRNSASAVIPSEPKNLEMQSRSSNSNISDTNTGMKSQENQKIKTQGDYSEPNIENLPELEHDILLIDHLNTLQPADSVGNMLGTELEIQASSPAVYSENKRNSFPEHQSEKVIVSSALQHSQQPPDTKELAALSKFPLKNEQDQLNDPPKMDNDSDHEYSNLEEAEVVELNNVDPCEKEVLPKEPPLEDTYTGHQLTRHSSYESFYTANESFLSDSQSFYTSRELQSDTMSFYSARNSGSLSVTSDGLSFHSAQGSSETSSNRTNNRLVGLNRISREVRTPRFSREVPQLRSFASFDSIKRNQRLHIRQSITPSEASEDQSRHSFISMSADETSITIPKDLEFRDDMSEVSLSSQQSKATTKSFDMQQMANGMITGFISKILKNPFDM
ncbi:hypothetical protein HDV06_000186 [Boothiomyces sp. JEL0866]|nr:hypothetical protein HDV06_000186 [Boothiomyces sp. JEL0866]